MLQYLASVAKGPSQQVEALVHVVSALFDINPSMSTHMALPIWKRCTGTLLQVTPPHLPESLTCSRPMLCITGLLMAMACKIYVASMMLYLPWWVQAQISFICP